MLTRLRAPRGDAGLTLMELIVAMALLSILGLAAFRGLVSGYRATTLVQNETEFSQEMQRAIERIAREVRVADRIEEVSPSGNVLQLRVIRDDVCSRYFYRQVGQRLMLYVQRPLLPAPAPIGSPSQPGRCTTAAATSMSGLPATVVIDDLAASANVFRFFDDTDAEITFPSGDIDAVAQVLITLRRNAGDRVVELSTRVDVRNKVVPPL